MNPLTWLKGALVGAGVMYFADPDKGEQRRNGIRDQAVKVMNELGDALDSKTREIQSQAQQALSDAGETLKNEPGVSQAVGALNTTPGRWSPTTRAVLSLSGGWIALKGAKLGGSAGLLTSIFGVALFIRGLADLDTHGGPSPIAPARPRLIDTPPFLNDPIAAPADILSDHTPREASFNN